MSEVENFKHDIDRHLTAITSAEDAIDKFRHDVLLVVAQLRHAYSKLAAGQVSDQRQLAEGLLAPQIRKLERIARDE